MLTRAKNRSLMAEYCYRGVGDDWNTISYFSATAVLLVSSPVSLVKPLGVIKNLSNARFYQLGINLGIANPRSEDNPRFGVNKTLLSLIPGITRDSRVIPS